MSSYGQFGSQNAYATTTAGIGVEPKLLKRIETMEKMVYKMAEQMAVLPEPDPSTLSRHKMLREAYDKYLFIENLCREADRDNES